MDKDVFYNRGIEFYDKKEYNEAINCFNTFLENNSKDLKAINYKGLSLMMLGDDDEAESLFDKALKINPDDLFSLLCKGGIIVVKGDFKKGLIYFKKVLELDPKCIKAYLSIAESLINQKKYIEAIEYIEIAYKIDPNNSSVLYYMGACYLYLEDDQKSKEYFDKIMSIDPENENNILLILSILSYLEKYDLAMFYVKNSLESNPENAILFENAGRFSIGLKKYEDANYYFDKALRLNPDDPDLLSIKGLNHSFLKEYDKAFKFINNALKIDSEFTNGYDFKGEIYYYDLKKLEDALDCFSKSLTVDPDNVKALIYCKRILRRLGRKNEAIKYEKRLNDLESDFMGIENQLENRLVGNLDYLKNFDFNLKLIKRQYSFRDKDGNIKFIDLLCKDINTGGTVIIELKVVSADLKTYDQISNYINIISKKNNIKKPIIGLVISDGSTEEFNSLIKNRDDISQINMDDLWFEKIY